MTTKRPLYKLPKKQISDLPLDFVELGDSVIVKYNGSRTFGAMKKGDVFSGKIVKGGFGEKRIHLSGLPFMTCHPTLFNDFGRDWACFDIVDSFK